MNREYHKTKSFNIKKQTNFLVLVLSKAYNSSLNEAMHYKQHKVISLPTLPSSVSTSSDLNVYRLQN